MGYGNGIQTLSKVDHDNPEKYWEKFHHTLKNYQVCFPYDFFYPYRSFQECANSRIWADSRMLICIAMEALSFPFTYRSSINSPPQVRATLLYLFYKKMHVL